LKHINGKIILNRTVKKVGKDRGKWIAVVNTVMKIPQYIGNFVSSRGNIKIQ